MPSLKSVTLAHTRIFQNHTIMYLESHPTTSYLMISTVLCFLTTINSNFKVLLHFPSTFTYATIHQGTDYPSK